MTPPVSATTAAELPSSGIQAAGSRSTTRAVPGRPDHPHADPVDPTTRTRPRATRPRCSATPGAAGQVELTSTLARPSPALIASTRPDRTSRAAPPGRRRPGRRDSTPRPAPPAGPTRSAGAGPARPAGAEPTRDCSAARPGRAARARPAPAARAAAGRSAPSAEVSPRPVTGPLTPRLFLDD